MIKKSVFAKFTPLLAVSLLALAACAGPAESSDEPPLDSGPGMGVEETPGDAMPIEGIEGTWLYADGSDPSGALTLDDAVTVTLTITGDGLAGESTCNNYSATLAGAPDELTVGPVISTKRACTDAALTDFETRYLAALAATSTAIPTGGSLVLQGNGVNLNFLPSSSLPLG
ncbi:META domain-containing protein [Salinibacterium amurskyense]|uniref:META domain-containing protein n=1 Tax=Salinibacterium amurskyense TaxID=205941 RepID=UPI00311D8635